MFPIARRACSALLALIGLAVASHAAQVSTALTSDASHVVVDIHGAPPPAPSFFSAAVDESIAVSANEIASTFQVNVRLVQGRPDAITFGLSGDGEITEVTGDGLKDWAIRQGTGAGPSRRLLELRLSAVDATVAARTSDLKFTIRASVRNPSLPGTVALLLAAPGDAIGFVAAVSVQTDPNVEARLATSVGLTPVAGRTADRNTFRFSTTGDARLEMTLALRGGAPADVTLTKAEVVGRANESAHTAEFHLRAEARSLKAGARLELLTGRAALTGATAGDGWHVELVPQPRDGGLAYELVCDRVGALAIDLPFAAAMRDDGDWRMLEFAIPAGAVVPVELEGLADDVTFKHDAAVVPIRITAAGPKGSAASPIWRGFLPSDGSAALAWKHTREAGEGALFFTSSELADVRIGAGLLRETSQITFRILQGKLEGVRCRIAGAGEILGVDGANVTSWRVLPGEGGRVLDVRFSRPIESEGRLVIRAQGELGTWPVRVEPLRLTPEGGVRHSGFLRVANSGAVRIEIADAAGMMQLAPTQFPGAPVESGARQVLVYRFPGASHAYHVVASPIQPEINVSEIATYELTDTARVLNAAVELDVREAPLREWSFRIPADYTIVAANGADVADYVAESVTAEGLRTLRILFRQPVDGRELLQLRLEKNLAAAAGDWELPALQFPGAKSVRGHIGAVATPGYRMAPVRATGLVEVPLSFFPRQTTGLQQAWRMREPSWSAGVRIEALGQSIQADVFHLYSLREGVVFGSVLLNYFVVGAPATEWRVEVPPELGNLDVTGQNVRRDWRREGNQVIVTLHQPVLGAGTLLITFEQPMSARGGVIAPGQVRPLNVQAERGFIQVVSPLQVKHAIRRAEGPLLKLEPTELPAEFRLFTNSPSLAVYQYTARPFAFEMGVDWYAPGETVEQVVDFSQLTSQISRDGQVVTEARFFVKTRGQKALRLTLPDGVRLWETRVNGDIVNAHTDGGQILVPLPARLNPNEPVVVAVRIGQPATRSGAAVTLVAPRTAAPAIISEWRVRGDTERVLVPRGGTAELAQPALTETGFEWIAQRAPAATFALLVLTALALWLLRETMVGQAERAANAPSAGGVNHGISTGPRVLAGAATCVIIGVMAAWLTREALFERRANCPELLFTATMVPAGDVVSVQLDNLPAWRTVIVDWGVAALMLGVAAAFVGQRLGRTVVWPIAAALIAGGLLAQRMGAVAFFSVVSVFAGGIALSQLLGQWRRARSQETPPSAAPGLGSAGATPLLVVGVLLVIGGGVERVRAAELPVPTPPTETQGRDARAARNPSFAADVPPLPDGTRPAQAMIQHWSIHDDRLFGEIDVTVRGRPGDSFLLLRPPAVLTDFQSEGLRVGKAERNGQSAYFMSPQREGVMTAHVRFEMPAVDRTKGVSLPTGPAAVQRVTMELDQGGWEFGSASAVSILPTPGLAEGRSGATLVLGPNTAATIELRPRRRELASEATQFFAEEATLYVPGPGVVNGFTRVTVRPVQGRVSELDLAIPKGLTVGDVKDGPVGTWRFDPQQQRLQVAIEPAQAQSFSFVIETQLGAGELPFALNLEPLRTRGAATEVGMIALAFAGDAQPEAIHAADLSTVNLEDFDARLLPRARNGQPLVTLQNVWRYGPVGGRVQLTVAPLEPEVRVSGREVLTFDDDRLLVAADLKVAIARVGLFKLSLAVREGLEIESLSGAALSHWTEAQENGTRVITLHLNGRTVGEQAFALTLIGAAPKPQDAWAVPRIAVREATRQTGELVLVPGKGLRLRPAARDKVTQLDPRSVGGMQPGTLAFRLLEHDWTLRVGIDALDPWITAQALEEITMREGQTVNRLAVHYRIDNAAVRHVQLRLPGLTDEHAATVRATGAAVSDIVRVAGTPDTWDVRFQRAVAGETDVQIEFQGPAGPDRTQEPVAPPELTGARQVVQFVALRGSGRLEVEPAPLPRGWTRVDWNAVPAALQSRSDRTVPAWCFRVAEPEGPLTVNLRRQGVADPLKLRVTQADLMTLFAPNGSNITAVELRIDVLEKSTLQVRLPDGARLFNTFVNGEAVAVVRAGADHLFYVAANTTPDRTALVRLVYAAAAGGADSIALAAPRLSVPLENVTWHVVVPPGYTLDNYRGALRLRDQQGARLFTVDDYQTQVKALHSANAQQAMTLLQQASSLLQKGDQEKAGEMLSKVSNGFALDAASNEDARVQLRNLKTQQAIVGLNTRRQRLYLDNKVETARNDQLEQAANLNPLMHGRTNFDPQEVDQLLQGNSAEENSALRGIAGRIVDQQFAAEPAPSGIDVTLPERGRVFTFTRSLQVDGNAPLDLSLKIVRLARANLGIEILLVLAVAVLALFAAQQTSAMRTTGDRNS